MAKLKRVIKLEPIEPINTGKFSTEKDVVDSQVKYFEEGSWLYVLEGSIYKQYPK